MIAIRQPSDCLAINIIAENGSVYLVNFCLSLVFMEYCFNSFASPVA